MMDPVEQEISEREEKLRAWFTDGCDPIRRVIDGLDIGWGGIQRWATSRLPLKRNGSHLDVACGYATFLAQLGWRYPDIELTGLNIDFRGPHRLAKPLLAEAGVRALLVQADARTIPFAHGSFSSASCFLGLQDIEIGFGRAGVRKTVSEMVRVVESNGLVALIDEYPLADLEGLLSGVAAELDDFAERELDVQWGRDVAEEAIKLYAEGWVHQLRGSTKEATEKAYAQAYARMTDEMNDQLANQGHYVPFGPLRMLVARKKR